MKQTLSGDAYSPGRSATEGEKPTEREKGRTSRRKKNSQTKSEREKGKKQSGKTVNAKKVNRFS